MQPKPRLLATRSRACSASLFVFHAVLQKLQGPRYRQLIRDPREWQVENAYKNEMRSPIQNNSPGGAVVTGKAQVRADVASRKGLLSCLGS